MELLTAPSYTSVMYLAAAFVPAFVMLVVLWRVARALLLEPWIIKKAFEKQGIKCLPYRVLVGNLLEASQMIKAARASPLPLLAHDIGPRIVPHLYHWKKTYGDLFVFWFGYRAVVAINNPEDIKEVLSNKFGHFKKVVLRPDTGDLMGESVATLEGERWAQHRRIVSPAFFAEKLKVMISTMIACTGTILDKWESQLEGHDSTEIEVFEQFKILTADVIAHTAFGSSYEEGKKVFKLQEEQMILTIKLFRSTYIPGYRYLPTPRNRCAWRLKKEVHASVQRIIQSRGENYKGDDLLGILMAASRKELSGSQKNLSLSLEEIVDECKTFFFAGQETTATLMTWTMLLLAINPEWQERAREEVLRVCHKEPPTYELLHNLKLVGMVLNEALRLYPPAAVLMREAVNDMTVGAISLPAKTLLSMPIIHLHCNPAWWGEDALDFNPQRFADGISNACKTPSAFCPFGMGPRICLGQQFAMVEAKAILAMILQRFTFKLSPGYTHCPITVITLQPEHGMQIIFKKLQ